MNKRERAVLYIRQSDDGGNEESMSLENQEYICREYARARGYEVVGDVLEDPNVSGRQFAKRPGIRQAIESIEQGEADVVVVWRWSRLSRKRTDQAVILDRIESSGGRAEAATEPIDTTTAGGRFSREVLLAAAVMESDQKSEMWKQVHAHRQRQGKPSGGPARFGYRIIPRRRPGEPQEPGAGMQVPVVDESRCLRQMYMDFIAGQGAQRIAKGLNDSGVPTKRGNTWGVTTVLGVLDSGFGAGKLYIKRSGEYLDGAHEPVITPEEWRRYQEVRNSRRQVPQRTRDPVWSLSGLAVCGVCGGRMNRLRKVRKEQVRYYIRCGNYAARRTCTGSFAPVPLVEHRVAMWLGGQIDSLASDDGQRNEERARVLSSIDEATAVVVQLETAQAELALMRAKKQIDPEAYEVARAQSQSELDAARLRLTGLRDELSTLAPAADVYEQLTAETEGMPLAEWRERLRKVLRRVEVHKDRLVIVPVVGETVTVAR